MYSDLIELLEREEITDFSEAEEIFGSLKKLKQWEKGNIIKELDKRGTLNGRVLEIKEKRIGFLEGESNKVLSVAMFVAGYSILNDLKRNQIRKVLEMMSNIKKRSDLMKNDENTLKREVGRVRYMLAYSAGRNRSVKPLMSVLDPLLADIKSYGDFERVYEFMQSIVAFHYYLGGGD